MQLTPIQNAILRMIVALMVTALLLFLPAGTVFWWQAWMFMLLFFIPMAIISRFLFRHDSELLKRRLKTREISLVQNILAKTFYSSIGLIFIISGLDKRFGWSNVPLIFAILSAVFFLFGYYFLYRVFKENKYLFHTVKTEEDQEVVTTGPYAVVRHPMYLSELIMFAFAPLALGSYWALAPVIALLGALIIRIITEEAVLVKGLSGYPEYIQKTRFHLIPGVW